MDCIEVRSRLASGRGADSPDRSMPGHLERCGACRSFAADLKLAHVLRSMPVPPPGPAFQARVDATLASAVTKAVKASPRPRRLPLALAAGILVAIVAAGLTTQRHPFPAAYGSAGRDIIVRTEPGVTRMVNVSVNSHRALHNATITLSIDNNISLNGRPGVHILRWQASIAAGENRITLPLTLRQPGNGKLTIAISANGSQRLLKLALSPHSATPKII